MSFQNTETEPIPGTVLFKTSTCIVASSSISCIVSFDKLDPSRRYDSVAMLPVLAVVPDHPPSCARSNCLIFMVASTPKSIVNVSNRCSKFAYTPTVNTPPGCTGLDGRYATTFVPGITVGRECSVTVPSPVHNDLASSPNPYTSVASRLLSVSGSPSNQPSGTVTDTIHMPASLWLDDTLVQVASTSSGPSPSSALERVATTLTGRQSDGAL